MYVFLSYASEDHALAERVCRVLETEGHDVFFDRDDLGGGDVFGERIRSAVARAHVLIFLISRPAVAPRSYALTELAIATGLSARRRPAILPVRTDDTPIDAVPASLRAYTILEPQGDSPAEIALAIDRLRRRLRQRRLAAAAGAAAAVVAVALGSIVYLAVARKPPNAPAGAPATTVTPARSPSPAGAPTPSAAAPGQPTTPRDPIEELNEAILRKTPPDRRVTVSGLPGNNGWTANLGIADNTVSQIHYRLDGESAFTNTGSTDNTNVLTGQPQANTHIRLPGPFWQRRAIAVKYTDTKGREHGPFELNFDPREQFLRFTKQVMGSIAWVEFSEKSSSEHLAYFTTLLSYKPALREIRYSVNSAALDQVLPFKVDPSAEWPARSDDEAVFIPVAASTRFMTVRLTFVDGSTQTQRIDAHR